MSCTDSKNEILKELNIEEIKEEKAVLDPMQHKKFGPKSQVVFEEVDENVIISRRGMRK
jgi:flagellar protein FliO/FliZ